MTILVWYRAINSNFISISLLNTDNQPSLNMVSWGNIIFIVCRRQLTRQTSAHPSLHIKQPFKSSIYGATPAQPHSSRGTKATFERNVLGPLIIQHGNAIDVTSSWPRCFSPATHWFCCFVTDFPFLSIGNSQPHTRTLPEQSESLSTKVTRVQIGGARTGALTLPL